jgi:hypothetical protein
MAKRTLNQPKQPMPKQPMKFSLKRETVMELGLDELALVSGGATASCCIGCNTCEALGTGTGSCANCPP